MYKNILMLLCCLTATNCLAIESYMPGDTLWVWAKSGLNIRAQPDSRSKILGKVENGRQVTVVEDGGRAFPFAVEEIEPTTREISDNEKVKCPNFELSGYWVKINYSGTVGYVFDAYLSKLQTFIGHQSETTGKDDFHVSALKKQANVLKQIGENQYGKDDHKFVRYIFDTGHVIDLSGGSGHWEKQMLFPDNLSLVEGYLIYAHTMHSETDILLEKGADYLKFEVETGFLTIKKVGSFLIIYEEHAC